MTTEVANAAMTRRERDDLAALVRRRERVAKTAAAQRSAELMADFEQKLAAVYKSTDDAWRDITATANRVVAEADQEIARRCRDLGIPETLRPGLGLNWYRRGESESRERRGELRKVAATRIAALQKRPKTAIEQQSVEVQTRLLAGGLESEAARQFLESMPTVESLMPPLDVAQLEAAMPGMRPALAAGTSAVLNLDAESEESAVP